ncbi:MAG TPA: aminoglycoside phosphotransferase family protein, partial [Geminicoccaceae bacterium]|nr:aminoglycoside phosphotransferase family protein [Geminicoccaceae bacterium]
FAAEGAAVDVITRIPGEELTDARYAALDRPRRRRLADDLARFLAGLHRPELAARAAAAGVPARSPWPLPAERIVAQVSPLLADAGRVRFLETAMGEYDAIQVADGDRVLVHNDLREDNMGFDPEAGRLCGVFDFGDVALDDRHRDFRGFPSIDLHLHDAVMRGYARLTGRELSRRRTLLYNAAGELSHLVHLLETGEDGRAAELVGPCLAELMRRLGR